MADPQARLAVIQGPDRGKKWLLDPNQYYDIGRSSDNAVVLQDKTVSKRHALIECVDGIWFIQDLGSKHGTWVENEQVKERRALYHKDVIRMGKTYLVVGAPQEQ